MIVTSAPIPLSLKWLVLAGAAAVAIGGGDACLNNLDPQRPDAVCGSDGVAYDSYEVSPAELVAGPQRRMASSTATSDTCDS